MADRNKDAEDRMLENLFRPAHIPDDGFSASIVRRIRGRIWIRRLALPAALFAGGGFAVRPLLDLSRALHTLLGVLPMEWTSAPVHWMPQLPMLSMGAILLVIAMLAVRMLEE